MDLILKKAEKTHSKLWFQSLLIIICCSYTKTAQSSDADFLMNARESSIDASNDSLGLSAYIPSRGAFRLSGETFPFCRSFYREYLLKNGKKIRLGTLPSEEATEEFYSQKENLQLQSETKTTLESLPYKVIRSEKCWYRSKQLGWVLAHKILYNKYQRLRRAYIYNNKTMFSEDASIFLSKVSSKIEAYASNFKDSTIKEFTVETEEGTKLQNRFFSTKVSGQDSQPIGSEGNFVFGEDTSEFEQANVFVHANGMLAFFQSIGYKFGDSSPAVILDLVDKVGGSAYNPQYRPSNDDNLPVISITPGDSTKSENGDGLLIGTRLDREVVYHEFAHHVITRYIRIDDRTRTLHEGLADYFTFATTNNSCLAEAICGPLAAEDTCYQAETCMRNGENDIVFNTETYKDLPFHQQGQVISGLLWTIRKDLQESEAIRFDRLALTAVTLSAENSDMVDYLNSLIVADEQNFKAEFSCRIFEAARAKGMEDQITTSECTSPITGIVTTIVKPKSKGAIEEALGCTVNISRRKDVSSAILLLILLTVPFLSQNILKITRGKKCT